MSAIDQKVRRARTRLMLNSATCYAAWGVLLAACTWMLVILVERALVFGIPLGASAATIAATMLVVVFVATHRARLDALRAAVELDAAAELKERLSTALTCRQSSDPFARATVQDAETVAARVHVPARVPYRVPDLWPWSLATVAMALLFCWLMPPLDLLAADEKQPDEGTERVATAEREAVEIAMQRQVERVKQRLEDKPGLAGLEDELEQLTLPDEPTRTPEDVRREAVKRIEKVSDRIKQRLEADSVNALEQLKRELAKLDTPRGDDAASKLSQALANGDMESARNAMEDLKKQLEQAAQAGDARAKAKLAEMQDKLDALSKKLDQLGDQQKTLKDLQNKAGLSEEQAKELMKQLEGMDPKQIAEQLKKTLGDQGMTQQQIQQMAKKIAQNQALQQQLKSMAQAMAQAAQACQQCQQGGQGQQSAQNMQNALDGMMGQLSDLEMAEQMANELEAQLAELERLKQGVAGGQCQGGMGTDPNNPRGTGPMPGKGYGTGVGKQRGAHGYNSEKAKTRTKGGQIIGQMLIDGPQVKGEATAEVADVLGAAVRDAQSAVEREEVPRQYQRIVQIYFDHLAGLMNQRQPPATEEPESTAEQPAPDETAEPEEDQ